MEVKDSNDLRQLLQTKIDLDKAKKFYMNAAEMGHKIAMERLKKFFDQIFNKDGVK